VQALLRTALLVTPLVLVVLCLVATQSVADDTDLRIDKALKASGMAGQMEHLAQAILSAVPEDAFPDKKTRGDAAAFLREHAGRDVLVSVVHAEVRQSLHADALAKVTNFFDSKVGKKVGRAQHSALETSVLKRIREGRPIVLTLHESRTELLKRIIRAQQVSEVNGRFLSTVIRGLVDGSSTACPETAHPEQTRRKISLIEKEIRAERTSTEDTALTSYAHLLRSLDDKELEELASFEESDPAAQFRESLQRGVDRAVYLCAKALGEYSVKPRPAPQRKPSRIPGDSPRERDRDPGEGTPWGMEDQ
jgi:hypothetical protein